MSVLLPCQLRSRGCTYQGRGFVIIRVYEFADIRRSSHGDISRLTRWKDADLYLAGVRADVRAYKPETSEIPSEGRCVELLELAIDKGVEKFVRCAQRVGLFPLIQPSPMPPDIDALFNDQAEDLQ